ncbi:uncharacterized protein LOC116128897 [Pistacia vera]|uniref:uncharacterized protein LOC116128897 n=1 Tax=Pistacia vera TaxID=55513 RepID=UPI001263D088|nr:uncharacterized protein LOC116128897 [Pistacia vera]
MKQHLAGTKGDVGACLKVPFDVQYSMRESLKDIGIKNKEKADSSKYNTPYGAPVHGFEGDMFNEDSEEFRPSGIHINEGRFDSKKQSTMLDKSKRNKSIGPLVDAIAAIGSGYKHPNYHALHANLLRDAKKEVSLINFMVYYPKGVCFVKSVNASDVVKDTGTLLKMFEEVALWIGPNSIVHFVSDNGSNYKAIGSLVSKNALKSIWYEKKDKIWEHVEELQGNKWKWKFCQKVFSGGAYRIKAHLSGITGHDVEICSKVNHETQACAFLAMSGSGSNKKLKSSAGSSTALNSNDHQEETDSPFSPLSKGSQRCQSQASLLEMNKKKDKEFVDKMLAKCFMVNNIAFNVVQTGAFGEFVKAMAEYGAAYKLPSYSTLRTKLIPESRKGVDEYVAMVKHSWDTSGSGCTIMSDIWTDIRHRSFINLVAYSPGGAVFIKSLDVSRERKTGIYLKEIFVSVIESIGQEHVVQFITDNGSNFTSAGDMLIGLYPRMYKTRCAAHGIQLLLKDIYEEVNWVKVATDEARIIVMFMTRYTVLHVAMKEFTKDRQLRQPYATRFASNFLMLQSVLDLENEIRLFVASSELRGFDYCKTESGKRVTEIV